MAEKMMDNKLVIGLALAVVAYMMIGANTAEEKTSRDVLNLPAIVEKVTSAEIDNKETREGARQDLKDFEQRNQAERNRRENETYDFVNLLDVNKKENMAREVQNLKNQMQIHMDYAKEFRTMTFKEISEIRKQEFDHVNTPKAHHGQRVGQ